MRVVLVVLCVVLVSGEPQTDSEAASDGSQWKPFFNAASRASEGLPWESVAPRTEMDSVASPSEDRKDVHKVTITKKVRVPYTVHVEKRIPKIIEVPVDKPFNVYVPKPYPVIVEKKVPYEIKVAQPQPYTVEKRVPYPVKVLVDKPYTLHVPKPYPVEVEKKYEFTVEKKIPYEVKVPVERPYPVHVIVEKEVKFPVEKKVPVPVKVPYEKPIPIHVTKHVPINVDKPVPYTVEKVTTYPVKVPFRIPIKMHYHEGTQEVPDVQNLEWMEAMNKATRAAKLEPEWHGDGVFQWQGEAQAESHRPQWQELRFNHVRQGFSTGRGFPTRNGYLGKYNRPTKLQPSHLYKVNEAQPEQHLAPFLTRPGSEMFVPQMVLTHRPGVELQQVSSGTGSRPLQYLSGFQTTTAKPAHSVPFGAKTKAFSSPFAKQNNTKTTFTITNVVHHSPPAQTNQRTSHAVPQGSKPTLPSSTFYQPAQNSSGQPESAQTPFGSSGFTISFQPSPTPKQQQQPQQTNPPLKPESGDPVSSSFVGTKTIREGQEVSYSSSIHHTPNSPAQPEQT